ncbi:MAG: glycosyltransferase family 2 protein [Proteobacteria bacterium]|nr:glycosyltransferase family 2 protein [Pseudomonadota bacterium]
MTDKKIYSILSTMKNEGPFILEWVAHHKALGFDHIVVCTNNCEDQTVEILKHLEKTGLIRHHPTIIRGGGIQRSAYRQARRLPEIQNADWVFVNDADEFLNIHVGDGSVRALVESVGDNVDMISIPWRIFGPKNIFKFHDRPVKQQFNLAEFDYNKNPEVGKFVKTLFHTPANYKRIGLHMPIAHPDMDHPPLCVMANGKMYLRNGKRTRNPPTFSHAQVNHYALRSAESFLIKRVRGRANHSSHTLGTPYWQKFDLNDVVDDSIRRYDISSGIWLEKFESDPVLYDLHLKAVDWHRNKAKELRQDPDFAPLIKDIHHAMSTVEKNGWPDQV